MPVPCVHNLKLDFVISVCNVFVFPTWCNVMHSVLEYTIVLKFIWKKQDLVFHLQINHITMLSVMNSGIAFPPPPLPLSPWGGGGGGGNHQFIF